MTPKTRNILIISAVLLTGLIIAGRYIYKQSMLLYNYCYILSGCVIKKFSLSMISMTVMVKLKNRSDITIDLGEQTYDVFINDYFVSKIVYKKSAKWFSNSSVSFPLDINFNPNDLLKAGLKNVTAFIADKEKIKIKVIGSINASVGAISLKGLKFEYEMNLKELLEPSAEIPECKNFK